MMGKRPGDSPVDDTVLPFSGNFLSKKWEREEKGERKVTRARQQPVESTTPSDITVTNDCLRHIPMTELWPRAVQQVELGPLRWVWELLFNRFEMTELKIMEERI